MYLNKCSKRNAYTIYMSYVINKRIYQKIETLYFLMSMSRPRL